MTTGNDSGSGLGWSFWFDGLHSATRREASLRWIVRAKHYADTRFGRSVRLEEMASEACLSKYHFIRAFRRAFRETPSRYVTRRRMERARELLERTDRSVTEIGFEVGFQSLGSFMNRFRRDVGESPGRYRRRFTARGPVDQRPMPACLYRALADVAHPPHQSPDEPQFRRSPGG